MSTTIYTGFKIPEKYNTGSITNLQLWINDISAFIKNEFNKKYCIAYNEISTNIILKAYYEKKDVNEETKKIMSLVKNEYPIPEICIYLYKDKVYGAFFKDKFNIYKKLLKRGYIEDFSYWDNTDQDEKVSEEEWEFRQEVWDSMENWHMTLNFISYLMYSGYYLKASENLFLKKYKLKYEEKNINSCCFSILTEYLYDKYSKSNEIYYYNDIYNEAIQRAKKLITNPELALIDEKEVLNKLDKTKKLYKKYKEN